MRVFAVSDLHVDYRENLRWVENLPTDLYLDDILILAGDVSEDIKLLARTFNLLRRRFRLVLFVPGNHEFWLRDATPDCSIRKLGQVNRVCIEQGVTINRLVHGSVTFVPLYSWYDYSFAAPDRHLLRAWRDFRACRWPAGMDCAADINDHFLAMNRGVLDSVNRLVISYSHFLPRIDLMPAGIPESRRRVYPVLGSAGLGRQVLQLRPDIHVYGHSHVNRAVVLDGIEFVNNAFGYPGEDHIARKQLLLVHDDAWQRLPRCAGQPA